MNRRIPLTVVLGLFMAAAASVSLAREPGDAAPRKPGEDVNSPDIRNRQGLRPGENLLFNGWGVSPAR